MWEEETALPGEEAEPLPPQHCLVGTSCPNKPSLVSSTSLYALSGNMLYSLEDFCSFTETGTCVSTVITSKLPCESLAPAHFGIC